MGSLHGIRIVGGMTIWLFKGFKVPLKDCINKSKYAIEIGTITVLVVTYIIVLFYAYIIN